MFLIRLDTWEFPKIGGTPKSSILFLDFPLTIKLLGYLRWWTPPYCIPSNGGEIPTTTHSCTGTRRTSLRSRRACPWEECSLEFAIPDQEDLLRKLLGDTVPDVATCSCSSTAIPSMEAAVDGTVDSSHAPTKDEEWEMFRSGEWWYLPLICAQLYSYTLHTTTYSWILSDDLRNHEPSSYTSTHLPPTYSQTAPKNTYSQTFKDYNIFRL